MKSSRFITVILILIASCSSEIELNNNDYLLIKSNDEKAVLVLFPCFPCDSEHTLKEANFIEELTKNSISVVLLNENQKLYLQNSEKENLNNLIESIFKENNLTQNNISIGGFSSGGNLAIQMASYLSENSTLKISSVFAVDSPIDLVQLYNNCVLDVERNVKAEAVSEGEFIVDLFNENLGNPNESLVNFIGKSNFIQSEKNQPILDKLDQVKIRFYAEPDTVWQKENRERNFENLNAFQLENAHNYLVNKGHFNTELIFTEDKGIRSNGQKHPHSWSIVEGSSLKNWILNY